MQRSALPLFVVLTALSTFSLSAQSTQCILVGPFHAPITQPHPLFNFVFAAASDTGHLRNLLEAAAQNGYNLCLSFLKSRRMIRDSNGHFDLTRFKAHLDAFKAFRFASYDSLILCHLLFDEPQDPTQPVRVASLPLLPLSTRQHSDQGCDCCTVSMPCQDGITDQLSRLTLS